MLFTSGRREHLYRLRPGPGGPGQALERSFPLRIPPQQFSVALGLAGLATAWRAAQPVLGTPPAVPDAINALTAVVLLVLGGLYALQGPRQVLADLRDPVQGPFVPVSTLTAMILAAALARYSFAPGRVLVIIFLTATITAGGWLIGQWIARDADQAPVHPGYYLPTVAGGMVGAAMLAQVHLRGLAEASFGLGIASWVLLGSVVLNRLVTARRLPRRCCPPRRSSSRRPPWPGSRISPWPAPASAPSRTPSAGTRC